MAELTSLSFRPGNTLLHSLDARFKLILVVMVSLSIVHAGLTELSAITILFVLLSFYIRLSIVDTAKSLRYFLFLLVLVFLARLLSTSGEAFLSFYFITITKNGIYEGLIVCWRLLLLVCLGLLLISTTRTSMVKRAVEWLLSPIPLIPEKRIATMMGLIVRFIPVIFHKTREVSEAQKARCSQNIKNPFIRLKRLAFPMVKSVFKDAENVATAMAARCYSETPTRHLGHPRGSDWCILALGTVFSIAVFIL
jgi:energy-coupling factor transporter transmembrane protein EcfT